MSEKIITIEGWFKANDFLTNVQIIATALCVLAMLICCILIMASSEPKKIVMIKSAMKKIVIAFVILIIFTLAIDAVVNLSGAETFKVKKSGYIVVYH